MAKNLGSKCKLCRRAAEKLFLKGDRCGTPKCAVTRKPYSPGAHGKTGRRAKGQSEYGRQLAQKQKIKRVYGISETQFRKHISDAQKGTGVVGESIIARLEMRLDNIIYRLGLAESRTQARQLVGHSMFFVNNKTLNIPSARISVGDVITVKPHKQVKNYFKTLQPILKKGFKTPGWLSLDPNNLEAKVLSKPTMDEVGMNLDAQAVVEFYSR